MASVDRVKVTAPTWNSDEDASANAFRRFSETIGGLVRSCKGGVELQNFMEEKLGKVAVRTKCLPSFISNDPDFGVNDDDDGTETETGDGHTRKRGEAPVFESPGGGPKINTPGDIGPPKDDVPTHPLNTPRSSTRVITPGGNRNEAYYKATLTYGQLSAEAKALDNHMYTVMQMNVKGSKAALLAHVTFSSYVQAMIVLHKHIDISSNSRKTEALESIDNLKLNGTVQQWALDSVSRFQELRDSKVTIEDYGLFCLVKSLDGKSKVVQHEMIRDINSADDKSHFPIYDMVQKYASEMAAVDGAKQVLRIMLTLHLHHR